MHLPGKPQSLWLATTDKTSYPSLIPNLEVDVAILGGGIAGIMTAYFLKQQGKKVAVIEAREIVSGTTGYTTAHLSVSHGLIYHHLISTFGLDIAKRYAQANQAAITTIKEITEKERIDCDYQPLNEFLFVPQGQDTSPLKAEFEATRKIGLSTQLVSQALLPFPTKATINYPHQARFHPRKFLIKIAEIINGNGSYIFEQTRAIDVKEGEPLTIETDKGTLKAKDVVVATLYPIIDRGFYFARQTAYSSYVMALTVNGDFPDQMFDSTEENSHYWRRQPYKDGYVVLVGGEGHQVGTVKDTVLQYQKLENYVRERVPVKSILYRWSTHDTFPHDRLPYIGPFLPQSKHLYVATGFQGWGMTNGTVAGILLGDLIAGKPNSWQEVYNPNRFKITKELLSQNLNVGKMFITSKLKPQPEIDTSHLKAGEWKIYDTKEGKVAAYRDEGGEVTAVSAVCQHLGCSVSFNTAEKTWDCPCHGSRYSLKGEVLYAPTVKPLPTIT